MRDGWCKHFTGTQNTRCKAGVCYQDVAVDHKPLQAAHGTVRRSMPCIAKYNPGGAVCEKREEYTDEELAEQEASMKRKHDLMAKGLSDCCEAPIDRSRVIESGRYKGHGPRYCSKCGKCLLIV